MADFSQFKNVRLTTIDDITYTCKRSNHTYTETIAKLPDTPPVSEKTGEDPSVMGVKKGDVDGDGKVTLLDAQLT